MKYDRRVLCLKDVRYGSDLLWIAGVAYDAMKHRNGFWSIRTELGDTSHSGPNETVTDFGEYFSDITEGASLLDAVRVAYAKGYFTMTGQLDIKCETPQAGSLSFTKYPAGEIMQNMETRWVCGEITGILEGFAKADIFRETALAHLRALKQACAAYVYGTAAIDSVLDEWIDIAESPKDKAAGHTVNAVEGHREAGRTG